MSLGKKIKRADEEGVLVAQTAHDGEEEFIFKCPLCLVWYSFEHFDEYDAVCCFCSGFDNRV